MNRNLAFTFEADETVIVAQFDWKGQDYAWDPARMSLQAEVRGAWTELSAWDARKSVGAEVSSKKWRLTLVRNHRGVHLALCAVRFVVRRVRCPLVCPVHANLLSDRSFSDVEVLVGERRFPAHRAVLAAASPVLRDMLRPEAQPGEIRLEGADAESVEAALEYMYTGVLKKGALVGVPMLAANYEIAGLIEISAPRLLENVTVENVVCTIEVLRPFATDEKIGAIWQRLLDIIQGSRELLVASMRGTPASQMRGSKRPRAVRE